MPICNILLNELGCLKLHANCLSRFLLVRVCLVIGLVYYKALCKVAGSLKNKLVVIFSSLFPPPILPT